VIALNALFAFARERQGELPFPLIVWGADELRRAYVRRRLTADQ